MSTNTHTVVQPPVARPPGTALVAGALAILLALAGGYGALYFTGLEGWGGTAVPYVTAYESISLFGVVAATAMLRRSSHGRVGLVAYGLFMAVLAAVKVLSIQEWSAIPFGVVGLLVAVLALDPRTRRFTG